MRINNVLSVSLAAITLLSCSAEERAFQEFDSKSSHIINPLIEVIRGGDGAKVKLDYIEKYYSNSIICFHSQYSNSTLDKKQLTKFKVDKPLQQIPGPRSYPENSMGMSIISDGNQYNFRFRIISSEYFNRFSPCVSAQGGFLTKNSHGLSAFED